jgi:1-phosphofructokinase
MLAAVQGLHQRGVAEVLLTLGGDGAVLSTADGGLWSARPPEIAVRSTVGAGDCSLAGYLLADLAGAAPAERLRNAVAYGAASASLPGSAVPTPAQVDGPAVRVTAGMPGSAPPTPPTVPAAGRDAR